MNGTFVEKIKVTDQWGSGGEKFRLVDRGAGPRELQIERDGRWVAESPQYVHGVLCARIEFLADVLLHLQGGETAEPCKCESGCSAIKMKGESRP